MIDLRSTAEALDKYIERYADLIPPPSRALQQRMDFTLRSDAPKVANEKPAWICSRPCALSEERALDRAKGCLLGLAVGDAVGTTLEFLPRDHSHVNDMVGGGPFNLRPGEWTGDTSMALCLADTYLASNDQAPHGLGLAHGSPAAMGATGHCHFPQRGHVVALGD